MGEVFFSVAKLDLLLNYVCHNHADYRDALLKADKLSIVWYSDEATGGNVLATSQSKKAMLWYIAVFQVGQLHTSAVWLPFCVIPSMDLRLIPGGFSAVTATMVRRFNAWARQGLHVCGKYFSLELKGIVGDYDALTDIFNAVGATGVKPCLLCQNCISKHQTNVLDHPYFKPVTTFILEAFEPYNFDELCETYDSFLQQWPRMTQAAKTEAQRLLGFSVQSTGLLACPNARSSFQLNKVILDSMHIYFANGIASRELLRLQTAWQSVTGIDLPTLAARAAGDGWVCENPKLRSPAALKRLFHPSYWQGTCYKGDAGLVWFLLPLVAFYAALSNDFTGPVLQSFQALLKVHRELKDYRRGWGTPEKLLNAQQEHLNLFKEAHGVEHVVPKHHLALHLAACYTSIGYVDCWQNEVRHQEYKTRLCGDLEGFLTEGKGTFSKLLMERLLLNCIEKRADSWGMTLEGQIWDPATVNVVTGLQCRISNGFRRGSIHLRVGDVFFLGSHVACIAKFFGEEDGVYVAFCTELHEDRHHVVSNCRQFRIGQVKLVDMTQPHFWQPAWWRFHEDKVLCLL